MGGLCCLDFMSPSLRGSGLKLRPHQYSHLYPFRLPLYEGVDWNPLALVFYLLQVLVSLFTREWIEMAIGQPATGAGGVSLFTREWIEMHGGLQCNRSREGLPLYEGVDWNGLPSIGSIAKTASPSLRGSGLKSQTKLIKGITKKSPSLRGSGLKSEAYTEQVKNCCCLPLYEGVDWNVWNIEIDNCPSASPSLRGSGLKCTGERAEQVAESLPLYEGVDWNVQIKPQRLQCLVSPSLRGGGLIEK